MKEKREYVSYAIRLTNDDGRISWLGWNEQPIEDFFYAQIFNCISDVEYIIEDLDKWWDWEKAEIVKLKMIPAGIYKTIYANELERGE